MSSWGEKANWSGSWDWEANWSTSWDWEANQSEAAKEVEGINSDEQYGSICFLWRSYYNGPRDTNATYLRNPR